MFRQPSSSLPIASGFLHFLCSFFYDHLGCLRNLDKAWQRMATHGNAWQSSKAIIVVVKDCVVGSCRFIAGSFSFSSIIALAFLIEVLCVVLLLQLMACRICGIVFCIKSSTSSQLALLAPPCFDLMQHPPGKRSVLLLGATHASVPTIQQIRGFLRFSFFETTLLQL